MSRPVKLLFLVHAVVSAAFGALLLIIPGRLLGWFDWAPIDPLLSRVLGAALLALAWGSFRGWQATAWSKVAILVELELAFTALAAVGLLRHLVVARWPAIVWLLFALYLAFAVAWALVLTRAKK